MKFGSTLGMWALMLTIALLSASCSPADGSAQQNTTDPSQNATQNTTQNASLGPNGTPPAFDFDTGVEEPFGAYLVDVSVDPLTVHPYDWQTMRLIVENPEVIVSAVALIETDNGTIKVPLNVTLGPVVPNTSRVGIYEAKWLVQNISHNFYNTTFVLKNVRGQEMRHIVTWSDPCSWPASGNVALGTFCQITSEEEQRDGNIALNNGAALITYSGAFVWTPGYSITISGNGYMQVAGGSFRQSYLWGKDGDGDGYAHATDIVVADSNPGGYVRMYTLQRNDCCDSSSTTFPGQSNYYTTTNACGSWDYNCNGQTDYWLSGSTCYETDCTGYCWPGCDHNNPVAFEYGNPGCGNSGSYGQYANSGCSGCSGWQNFGTATQSCH